MTGTGRLRDLAADLDAERFVGRADALAAAAAALSGASVHRVLYVYGPGGVGKSAFLRSASRLAERTGRSVRRVDGRLAPARGELAEAVSATAGDRHAGSVVVIDEVDELASLHGELRDLIAAMPATTVVVLAGRMPPEPLWFDGALAPVTAEIRLRPLDIDDSRELMRRYGVTDRRDVEPILSWAAGYPLALTLAATSGTDATADEPTTALAHGGPGQELRQRIVSRLAGRELDDVDPDVLDVAGIAPLVDARLMAAVLPSRPTRVGLRQLREASVTESVGGRVALHHLVRDAVRTRLRSTDPERYRTLAVRGGGPPAPACAHRRSPGHLGAHRPDRGPPHPQRVRPQR